MEASMGKRLVLSIFIVAASATSFTAVFASSTCDRGFRTFLHDLNSQCPLSIPFSSSPIRVDGQSFEETLKSIEKNAYMSVLFYASWCPFSNILQSQFSTLSSLYPQIKHLMVEQSSAMPSVFSRYGIHSVPSLVIVHQTTRTRYHGQKDLRSIIEFYKRTTGLKPSVDVIEAESHDSEYNPHVFRLWDVKSLKEAYLAEPYLLISVLFVFARAFLYFFPGIASCVTALWMAHIPIMNLGIFGDSRQILGRVLHLVDIKRIWSKLNLCKTRNFHKGARNARVWASSLASVSLGETSSSRVLAPCNL